MKNNQSQDPVQISIDKKNQNKNAMNNIIPQSTKNSGHSKIKGFSFQPFLFLKHYEAPAPFFLLSIKKYHNIIIIHGFSSTMDEDF